ncbi:SIS domain-containing protein [Wilcoxina mikolae CBS 423.85]|nr:SIS domain-containing protein [Wilcoxina mikolae CBS 423.85]
MLAFPITPPTTDDVDPRAEKTLLTATHVLSTEAAALSCLSRLYATDPLCRDGFLRAVDAIVDSQEKNGKIIVIGVGKSGKIGDKLVATMNSLGLMTIFLNPVEALHGDLGVVRKNDLLLLITFSGKTPELLQLLPHLPAQLPLIVLTSHTSYHTLPLIGDRDNAILLPAPIPESEVASFGIAAPTTSTTVAMALGDALALSAADRLHDGADGGMGPREVFRKNHPGGAIGLANKMMTTSKGAVERIRALAVRWTDIPIADDGQGIISPATEMTPPSPAIDWSSSSNDSVVATAERNTNISCSSSNNHNNTKVCYSSLRVLDCLRMAVGSPKGWLRTTDGGLIPPKKLQGCHNLMAEVYSPNLGLVVDVNELVKIPADTTLKEATSILHTRRLLGEVVDDTVVVVVENGKVYGVLEVGDVIERGDR